MAVDTTTLSDVIARMIERIRDIAPAHIPESKFDRIPSHLVMEVWARGGSECFRTFEIERTGGSTDPGFMNPAVVMRQENLTITVAYPVIGTGGFYGQDELDAMERVVRSDARQIRDAVFSPAGYVDGQLSAFVAIAPPAQAPQVWLQSFEVTVLYHEAQSI